MAYYICTKCEIRMRPEKNDVRVEEYAGNDPYKIWSADLWKCPSCGIEVIVGFGLNPVAEHFQEKYADFAKSVTHRILEKPKPVADARRLFQALLPFAIAAEEYKTSLRRPIRENALDECIEIEAGFCENAQQAITAYQKEVNCAAHKSHKPAPDVGLVEGIKEAIHLMKNEFLPCINNDCECRKGFGLCSQCKEAIYSFVVKYESALAAHKPEVGKYGDCPYCGTELVKRDTYGCGGDESFDWCPDCERVIEDAEAADGS